MGLSHSLPPGPWQRAPSPLRVTTPWPQSQPPVPKWAAPLAPSTSLLAAPTQPIQHRSLPGAQRGQMERRGACSTFLPAAKAGPWGPDPPRSETNPSNSLNLRDGIWPPGGKGNLDRALQVSQPRPRGPGTPEPSVTPSPMTAAGPKAWWEPPEHPRWAEPFRGPGKDKGMPLAEHPARSAAGSRHPRVAALGRGAPGPSPSPHIRGLRLPPPARLKVPSPGHGSARPRPRAPLAPSPPPPEPPPPGAAPAGAGDARGRRRRPGVGAQPRSPGGPAEPGRGAGAPGAART